MASGLISPSGLAGHRRPQCIGEQILFLRGVQIVHMDARNNFSFGVSFRKCPLTHQDATCPPSLALDPWRTGRVLERSHGVQDIHMDIRNHFSFCAPFRKCHLTHQDSTCPPSLELDPWRTGHYEKTCSGMNSFRNGMNLFRIGMNSFRTGMKSFRIDTGIWGNEKCQKIKLFM